MNINVSLNGIDLEPGKDFYLHTKEGQAVKVILRRPKPSTAPYSFWEKLGFLATGQWSRLNERRPAYPDFVSLENWDAGWRESFFFGTQDFDNHILYEEDLQKEPANAQASKHRTSS